MFKNIQQSKKPIAFLNVRRNDQQITLRNTARELWCMNDIYIDIT